MSARTAMLASSLIEPFHYGFFRRGILVAAVAGALCGLIGVFVVLRGMSYIGHGLSHAIFGGFAASSLIGVNAVLGAGVWGLASALMIGGVTRRRIIGSDAAIGVITTASFAVGLVLADIFRGPRRSFDATLFGSVLGVGVDDVYAVFLVGLLAAVVVWFGYRKLLFVTFDPEVADVSGVRVARVDAMLMLVLAACIIVTMRVVGVTLLAAVLVIPATFARLLTNSFARMLVIATVFGGITGAVGMYLSYHLEWKTGPTIVLLATALFAAAFVVAGSVGRRRLGAITLDLG